MQQKTKQLSPMIMSKSMSVKMMMIMNVLLLSACATDPYTGQQKPSKAAIGAIAGAVIGAATSSKSDRKKGALIGAAVGGGGGFYMDKQEQKLRAKLEGTGVSVTRDGDNILLNMPGNVTFETNRSDIQSSFYPVLGSVTSVFKEFKKTKVRISGHTDSKGAGDYNQRLSEKRASSVGTYLNAQGIAAERIEAFGYGEQYPVASNETKSGRSANRRVEIEIIPIEGS